MVILSSLLVAVIVVVDVAMRYLAATTIPWRMDLINIAFYWLLMLALPALSWEIYLSLPYPYRMPEASVFLLWSCWGTAVGGRVLIY